MKRFALGFIVGLLFAGLMAVIMVFAAIRLGGSWISDYVDARGERGWFQLEHQAYGREGEPCAVCGTPIRKTTVVQRGTHYCPRCQRR